MTFSISKKRSSEISKIIAPSKVVAAEGLEAVEDQYAVYTQAVNAYNPITGNRANHKVDLSQQKKFGDAAAAFQNRLDRLKKFQDDNPKGYYCLVLSNLTQEEINEMSPKIDKVLENITDPQEKVFFEVIKESLNSYKDGADAKKITTRQIPFLPEEIPLLNSLLKEVMLDQIPKEIQIQWLKDDIDKNPKTTTKEKELLNYLCVVLEKESLNSPDETNFSKVADQHLNAVLSELTHTHVSTGWKGAINSICEFFKQEPYYTELDKKTMNTFTNEFTNMKTSLVKMKENSNQKDTKLEQLEDKPAELEEDSSYKLTGKM